MSYADSVLPVPSPCAAALSGARNTGSQPSRILRGVAFLPEIPDRLTEIGGKALQWPDLVEHLSNRAQSSLGQAWIAALQPSANSVWIHRQQQRNSEMKRPLAGGSFNFRGIFDVTEMLDKARIEGVALDGTELLTMIVHAERVEAWRQIVLAPPDTVREQWPGIEEMSAPLLPYDLGDLLRSLGGKIEPDGSLSDHASPELARIRRSMAQQHRVIVASLRRALAKLSDDGSTRDSLITVRGERFVIPVKAEFKRKVGGVIHGSSSSGQTVFVEPTETIEHNNELTRLLDEEQAEVHRILVVMTRVISAQAEALLLGAAILAEADAHQAIAHFAVEFECVRPGFADGGGGVGIASDFELLAARHPLLEIRLRAREGTIIPLHLQLPHGKRQMIISGPNTGGKTVALKTAGLLALMAQAGMPVPAKLARLPLFAAVYADIGDAQSIERNLSTFSSHIVNVGRIAGCAEEDSLVLLDELGSATDPEEGAALAVAVAEHFLNRNAWCIITTHLTALKVYAAKYDGVLNAAVGFDEMTLSPTYDLRLGVPGASAGLNIAARLGLDPAIVTNARAHMTTQQVDIGRFLDELHAQLTAAASERDRLAVAQHGLDHERRRLEQEGRADQQAQTRALERQLAALIEGFESQLRDTVKAIDDKTVAQKIARDSALRIAQLKREFSAQFQSTVVAHNAPSQNGEKTQNADRGCEPRAGDMVRLKSLNREGRVVRVIDAKTLEVEVGAMKMRVVRDDVIEVVGSVETSIGISRRRGGVTVSSSSGSEDSDYMSSEINVIGRTADEAESDVDRFVERAFLAGLPRIRIVHGTGMGILRRTLREFLSKHPHVISIAEPPYSEGGQGVTIVELRP
jgi:DNA mismatch repair protein MutS2